MNAQKRARSKKFYTVAEANATLPLLRSILRDITELARDLHERQERLESAHVPASNGDAYKEELRQVHADLERDQERMHEYEQELKDLGVELKDYLTGLVDFPCLSNDHPIYLCWRLGEPEVAYWHELDAGFAGRKRIKREMPQTKS
jgi:hypothetical protein